MGPAYPLRQAPACSDPGGPGPPRSA